MSYSVEANIREFHEKLNEFWVAEKYCDITVKVGAKSFRCHRLVLTMACEYFDAMFDGRFRDYQDEIVLQEGYVEATAFEEILRFAYTGNVLLTKDNVFSVLIASEFFELVPVEKLCTEYIQNNLPISKTVETFVFACQAKKSTLMVELSRYIMRHFNAFHNHKDFIDLSFEHLNILVSQQWYLPQGLETHFLDMMLRWLNYSPIPRGKYFDEDLLQKIKFQFSTDYDELILRKFWLKLQLIQRCDHNSRLIKNPSVKFQDALDVPNLGLHVYMEDEFDKTIVFSACKNIPIWTKKYSIDHCYDFMQNIGVKDHLFSMDCTKMKQTFRVSSTLDISPESLNVNYLKTPPVIVDAFDLCNIRNNIFVNSFDKVNMNLANNMNTGNSVFSRKEISQGIYWYNMEIDKWYPMPLLQTKLDCSSLVACNDVLYLVEFLDNFVRIQFLDYRTPKWQNVVKPTTYRYAVDDALCCFHEGKIYAVHDSGIVSGVSAYDLVAGKWREIKPMNEIYSTTSLVSYESWLWAIGYITPDSNLLSIEVYNDCVQEWSPSPIAGSVNCNNINYTGIFKDAVVFQCY